MTEYFWRQREFVLSTFHAVPSGAGDGELEAILKNAKRAGLSHVETAFSSRPAILKALALCDDIGLKVIVQDLQSFSGFQDRTTAAASRESIEAAVREYGRHRSLDGYYIWDEPFLEQLEFTAQNMRILKELAPDKIMLVALLQSYSPDYHWTNGLFKEYIDRYIEAVNPPLLSFDYYVFDADIRKGIPLDDSYMWMDMAYIRKKALDKDIPYWYYIQLIGDIPAHSTGDMTAERVAMQAYVSLAFGATGIQYFNIIDGIMDAAGTPNHLYAGVRDLNCRLLSSGKALFRNRSVRVYHTSILRHRDYLDSPADSAVLRDAPAGLFVGEFAEDEGWTPFVVVNTNYDRPASGELMLKNGPCPGEVLDQEMGVWRSAGNTGVMAFSLPAGGGAVYRVKQGEE